LALNVWLVSPCGAIESLWFSLFLLLLFFLLLVVVFLPFWSMIGFEVYFGRSLFILRNYLLLVEIFDGILFKNVYHLI
jgi:hypothetical protein